MEIFFLVASVPKMLTSFSSPPLLFSRILLDASLKTGSELVELLKDSSISLVHEEDLVLEEKIGHGGFGQVWKGKWGGTNVAIKVLFSSDDTIQQFVSEVKVCCLPLSDW